MLVLDNHYDAETAVRNADKLVEEQVDLVIEFQVEQGVAAVIADKISSAGIPLIAVDMPHPHATYFGADNYRIGFSVGEVLGKHAVKRWKSKVSWVLGLELEQAGSFVQNRITGAFDGIRAQLPDLPVESFVRMDSRGLRDKSYKLVLDFLRRHKTDRGLSLPDTTTLSPLALWTPSANLNGRGPLSSEDKTASMRRWKRWPGRAVPTWCPSPTRRRPMETG